MLLLCDACVVIVSFVVSSCFFSCASVVSVWFSRVCLLVYGCGMCVCYYCVSIVLCWCSSGVMFVRFVLYWCVLIGLPLVSLVSACVVSVLFVCSVCCPIVSLWCLYCVCCAPCSCWFLLVS